MRRTVITLAAAAACVLGAGIGVASAAAHPADVNPTVLYTGPANAGGIPNTYAAAPCADNLVTCTDSMAGWYTDSFGQLFTQVDASYTVNTEAEGMGISFINGEPCVNNTGPSYGPDKTDKCAGGVWSHPSQINGAIGIQLCNETTDFAAQLGTVYLGDNQFATGYLTGKLYGLTVNGCAGGGVLYEGLGASASTTFTALGVLPAGADIRAQIKDDNGFVLFTAAQVNGVASYTYLSVIPWFFPNEAGAGLQSDTTGLSAPAVNDLTDFTGVTATSSGVTTGLANWNAVEVAGSQDGIAPALLAPTMITPGTGSVCIWHPGHREYAGHFGHRVYFGPKGHRKYYWQKGDRHYYWVNGYRTCAGGGPSSFSVDAGTPVS